MPEKRMVTLTDEEADLIAVTLDYAFPTFSIAKSIVNKLREAANV